MFILASATYTYMCILASDRRFPSRVTKNYSRHKTNDGGLSQSNLHPVHLPRQTFRYTSLSPQRNSVVNGSNDSVTAERTIDLTIK